MSRRGHRSVPVGGCGGARSHHENRERARRCDGYVL